jgi:hypothetical protein
MPAHMSWFELMKIPYSQVRRTYRRQGTLLDYVKFQQQYQLLRDVARVRSVLVSQYSVYRALFDENRLPLGNLASVPIIPDSEQIYFRQGTKFDDAIMGLLDSNNDEILSTTDRHGNPERNRRYYLQLVFNKDRTTLKRLELITFKNPIPNDDHDNSAFGRELRAFPHKKELLWHLAFPGGDPDGSEDQNDILIPF